VAGDAVVEAAGHSVYRPLELRVLERGDPSATVAHQVMMMFTARVGGLEASRTLPRIEPLDESQLLQQLEGSIDGGDANVLALVAQSIADLPRGQNAVLAPEEANHSRARPRGPMTGGADALLGMLDPVHGIAGGGTVMGHAKTIAVLTYAMAH
jgi:hypothetical protein